MARSRTVFLKSNQANVIARWSVGINPQVARCSEELGKFVTIKDFQYILQRRWLLHPMLLLSMALHGLILFFPVRSSDNQMTESTDVFVEIVSLPESSNTSDEKAPRSDDGRDEASPTPTETDVNDGQQLVDSAVPFSSTSIAPMPSLDNNAALNNDDSSRDESAHLQSSSMQEMPTHSPLPFAGFPHMSNGNAGCFGLGNCRQVEGQNFREVSVDLVAQLETEGYEVRSRRDLEDTGIKVYEVTSEDTTQFLSFLQPELGASVYILAAEPVTLSDLNGAETIKARFESMLRDVSGGQYARYADFSFPTLFFNGTTPRPEIGDSRYTVMETQPDGLAVPLTTQLTSEGFAVEQIGDYAGVPLYEVSQGAFVAYLSIMPTQDNTGTILVAWNRLPE